MSRKLVIFESQKLQDMSYPELKNNILDNGRLF